MGVVLWAKWEHRGKLSCERKAFCSILLLRANQFHETVVSLGGTSFNEIRRYAKLYVAKVYDLMEKETAKSIIGFELMYNLEFDDRGLQKQDIEECVFSAFGRSDATSNHRRMSKLRLYLQTSFNNRTFSNLRSSSEPVRDFSHMEQATSLAAMRISATTSTNELALDG